MANKAKIRIYFESNSSTSESIVFNYTDKSGDVTEVKEKCVKARISANQYTKGDTTEESVTNYYDSSVADYGFRLLVEKGLFYVDFFANDYGEYFSTVEIPSNITATITEEDPPAPEFGITNIEQQPPQIETPCDNQRLVFSVENETFPIQIKHSAEGTEVTKTATQQSELWIELTRTPVNTDITLTSDYGGTEETATGTIPKLAKYDIDTVNVSESATGATITINKVVTAISYNALSLQYSLDGTTYQDSNTFDGILPGDYTAYMRDEYNCVKTQTFTVEGLETPRPDPLVKVEKANPLKFVDAESPDIKNVNNTLLNDYQIQNTDSAFWRQPWALGNVVRTQVKTSYRNLSVEVIDDCTGEISQTIAPERKVKNIGQNDKRDCRLKGNAETGNFIIYFPQGDIYDPETDSVIGSYFSRGELPNFAQIGIFVQVTGESTDLPDGTFEVIDIVYDESVGYWCMEIDADFVAVPWSGYSAKCLSTYNAENWDIYEFNFTENEGQFHVEINATDENSAYPDKQLISEPFFFTSESGLVHVKYSSKDNQNGIDYSTGIVFEMNTPGRFANYSPAGEDETFEDDFGRRVIQKSVYIQQLQLQTSLIPMWIAERLIIASAHDNLEIDGESCTMTEKPEVESKISENNRLYLLTGTYQLAERVIFSEQTGIVSGSRAVLGTDSETIIGV